MTTHETELKTLMLATPCGDAAAYRALLAKLVPRLRAYYKRRMIGAGRGAELVMRSTIILVPAVIRASGERRSGLICPISKTLCHPLQKMQAPCGGSVAHILPM
jgi:hypothetical protein